jgi:hypothetical protein
MPVLCGQRWTGTTRASHSPSAYTIDFNTPNDLGKPAVASAPGVVTKAVSLTGSYGRYVIVDHGGGYTTLYAHLNQIVARVGMRVDQGELLGYVGGSGNVTGPHLHFEERKNGAYFAPYLHRARFRFGTTVTSSNCNDRPVVGDWNGDGVSDVGIFRTGAGSDAWHLRSPAGLRVLTWGRPGDLPVVGDFDGDKITQLGVRRMGAGSWVLRSRSGARATVSGLGQASDLPVAGDWDGNGRANLAVYRGSTHTFYLRADNGSLRAVSWGAAGDLPAVGDWNGDRVTDLGSYTPSTGWWTLRVPTGTGFVSKRVKHGNPGDLPAAGDWNGDGITDQGVWRPSTGTFWERMPGASPGTYTNQGVKFGLRR